MCDEITGEPVRWSTGQPQASADAVRVGDRPGPAEHRLAACRNYWTSRDSSDVTPQLQVPGHPNVFAVGDVAATDPLRSSARNRGDGILAHNIRAEFAGKPLRSYRAPKRRWGSVLGVQPNGLGGLHTQGPGVPLPGVVVRPGADARDRPVGDLPRRARQPTH